MYQFFHIYLISSLTLTYSGQKQSGMVENEDINP